MRFFHTTEFEALEIEWADYSARVYRPTADSRTIAMEDDSGSDLMTLPVAWAAIGGPNRFILLRDGKREPIFVITADVEFIVNGAETTLYYEGERTCTHRQLEDGSEWISERGYRATQSLPGHEATIKSLIKAFLAGVNGGAPRSMTPEEAEAYHVGCRHTIG